MQAIMRTAAAGTLRPRRGCSVRGRNHGLQVCPDDQRPKKYHPVIMTARPQAIAT